MTLEKPNIVSVEERDREDQLIVNKDNFEKYLSKFDEAEWIDNSIRASRAEREISSNFENIINNLNKDLVNTIRVDSSYNLFSDDKWDISFDSKQEEKEAVLAFAEKINHLLSNILDSYLKNESKLWENLISELEMMPLNGAWAELRNFISQKEIAINSEETNSWWVSNVSNKLTWYWTSNKDIIK